VLLPVLSEVLKPWLALDFRVESKLRPRPLVVRRLSALPGYLVVPPRPGLNAVTMNYVSSANKRVLAKLVRNILREATAYCLG
jgi:hypothetical protein